ncbi:5313_t:CDS:2 [Scutellospora calospora]|uniref:5313_t:CDS:1 n=1 Tax=Scutellospora calospora TaxID=85575 RepID=A0ACA9MGL8_9GLOM|nr:5313_t:CDS:2 [Scutellospora calospora]
MIIIIIIKERTLPIDTPIIKPILVFIVGIDRIGVFEDGVGLIGVIEDRVELIGVIEDGVELIGVLLVSI